MFKRVSIIFYKFFVGLLLLISISTILPETAFAQIPPADSPGGAATPGTQPGVTTNDPLPWEAPLCTLQTSLTGVTARAIALIGLFVAGGLLVFGGELSDFGRRITWMVLAISVMMAGTSLLNMISTTTVTNCALPTL